RRGLGPRTPGSPPPVRPLLPGEGRAGRPASGAPPLAAPGPPPPGGRPERGTPPPPDQSARAPRAPPSAHASGPPPPLAQGARGGRWRKSPPLSERNGASTPVSRPGVRGPRVLNPGRG